MSGPFSQAYSGDFNTLVEPDPPVPYDGCLWPLDSGCLGPEWDDLDSTVQNRSAALASATLHRLTGYQVGGCPITVRPCKKGCAGLARPAYLDMVGAYGGGAFSPHIAESGMWVNSCGCVSDCACETLCSILLPPPVGRVDEIKVDGMVVPPTSYRVDGNEVIWTAGATEDCPWPTCQDMALPDTEPGTFSITYLNSYPVDGLGAYAAGTLAMEFAKACTSGKCRLPAGVTSITRAGVSMEITAGSFPNGFTGIREIDAFIALYNPTPIRQAPQVWSPDLPRVRVTR